MRFQFIIYQGLARILEKSLEMACRRPGVVKTRRSGGDRGIRDWTPRRSEMAPRTFVKRA